MARRTATDFVREVRDNIGGELAATISDDRILRYLNDEYLMVCSDYKFDQLGATSDLTTVSGTSTYEASVSDILDVEELVDRTNYIKLYPMSEYQYLQYTQGNESSTTGNPVYWFVDGVGSNDRWNFTLYPTPAGAYTVRIHYKKIPSELVLSPSASVNSTIIPQQFDRVIVCRATWSALNQLGETDEAYRWLQISQEEERRAVRSSRVVSWVPIHTGSIVGRTSR